MTAAITDFAQFSALRAGADTRDPAAVREVAGQFEALFVESLMKNMRAAKLADPIFGNQAQHETYQRLLDQQYALELTSGKGLGLADMLVDQLTGDAVPIERSWRLPLTDGPPATGDMRTPIRSDLAWEHPEDFVQDVWKHAQKAARRLGVSAKALVAQAALETGWGQHVMSSNNGANSFNLFGIKAGPEWDGATAVRPTIEFVDGVARRETAKFRAYPNIAAAFDDYVRLIDGNPRFANVRNNSTSVSGFAEALQAAGYATDPQYASKISEIATGRTMRSAIADLKIRVELPITSRHGSLQGR